MSWISWPATSQKVASHFTQREIARDISYFNAVTLEVKSEDGLWRNEIINYCAKNCEKYEKWVSPFCKDNKRWTRSIFLLLQDKLVTIKKANPRTHLRHFMPLDRVSERVSFLNWLAAPRGTSGIADAIENCDFRPLGGAAHLSKVFLPIRPQLTRLPLLPKFKTKLRKPRKYHVTKMFFLHDKLKNDMKKLFKKFILKYFN